MSELEKEILSQDISDEELSEVSGGVDRDYWDRIHNEDCQGNNERQMHLKAEHGDAGTWWYVPYFPNCAATVEENSWCASNDACYLSAVVYIGMNKCSKAWE